MFSPIDNIRCVMKFTCTPVEFRTMQNLNFRAQQLDQYRHIEAWIIAEDILNSILNEIVSSEDAPSNEDNNNVTSNAAALIEAGGQEEDTTEPTVGEESLTPLSDTAREQDKTMRLTILQKLLELACAMVTFSHLLFTS